MTRARMILRFGDTQAFVPFDRLAQLRDSQGKSLGQLLDEFARLRSENLGELRALNLQQNGPGAAWTTSCTLGVVTLSQLLATWAAHDSCTNLLGSWPTNTARPWTRGAHILVCCSAPDIALLNEPAFRILAAKGVL